MNARMEKVVNVLKGDLVLVGTNVVIVVLLTVSIVMRCFGV